MSLNDFSNVTVSGDGPAISQVGFGTLMIPVYHTENADRSRTYTSLAELVTDGHDTDSAGYLAVQRAFQQSPRPTSVKLGRLGNAPAMTFRLTPTAVNGATYRINVKIQGEEQVAISITADSSTSVDEICDALEAAIDAASLTGLTTTPSGGIATHLDLIATAGLFLQVSGWDPTLLTVEDITADPGITADLNAIRAADADWYGLALPYTGDAITKLAADFAETLDMIHAATVCDGKAMDSGNSTDLQSVIDGLSYKRTICAFSMADSGSMAAVACLAERFPFDPGAPPAAGGDFNAKTWAGVAADPLTPTQKSNLRTKGYTVHITTAGISHSLGGDGADGTPIDYTRFNDWYRIRLQEKIFAAQMANDRIPYDDVGLGIIRSVCQEQLDEGLRSGGISATDADGNPPSITIPKLSETTTQNRAARVLPNVRTFYKYAGGIRDLDPVIINVSL